jgi:hypothetical protein
MDWLGLLGAFGLLALCLRWALRPIPLPASESPEPVLEARYNGRAGLLAFCAGTAGLYWTLGSHGPAFQRTHEVLLSSLLACFGAIALFDRRVKLRIDPVGIRWSRWGGATVHWAELERVDVVKLHGAPQLRLVPVPGFAVNARMPRLLRMHAALSRSFGVDEFTLSTHALDYGLDQIHAVIAEYLYKNK